MMEKDNLDRKWELYGPPKLKLSLAEVAQILGYEDAASIRRLASEGRLPHPRGHGTNQYYTGLDVAIILEIWGRWHPPPPPPPATTTETRARTSESEQKRAKTSENERKNES